MIFSKNNSLSHYWWGNNCEGWVFVDRPELSVKMEKMPPATTEKAHYHQHASQLFYILKGEASFLIDGLSTSLKSGEGLEILPGVLHRISNEAVSDLEFILYSSPNNRDDRNETDEN